MKTLSLRLDDDLDAALTAVCAEEGRTRAEVGREAVRRYLRARQLRSSLRPPDLAALYEQLASEDVALAEAGMEEYDQALRAADNV
jgi:metal-responsive CopG/Arc/MetJ family transcriptional regulator